MKEKITKVVIVAALITTLSGCDKNSSTFANRHERSATSSKATKKKYMIATYDDNGQKTESFESNDFGYDEDNFPGVGEWEWYPDVRPTATYNLEDDNKKISWVVNKGVSLIAYEGTINYFEEYNRQKKDQKDQDKKDLTKPEVYKFYQYLKRTKHYNNDEKVLFIKANTGVIIGAFTGKNFTYDYDYDAVNNTDINIFNINGHTVITQNCYFTAYPIKEIEKMGDEK